MGSGINKSYKAWFNPAMNLTAITAKANKSTGSVDVTAVYNMPDVKATLTLTYGINPDGKMKVTEAMTTDKTAKVSDMFRFGMVMDLPYNMDKSTFYGRGPIEKLCRPQTFAEYRHLYTDGRRAVLSLYPSAGDRHEE